MSKNRNSPDARDNAWRKLCFANESPRRSSSSSSSSSSSFLDYDFATEIPFTHAWWSEGAEFRALGLSDGQTVATLPDEVGTADAVQASESLKPVYRAATPAMNNRPTIEFDDSALATSSSPTYSQPFTFVAILAFSEKGNNTSNVVTGTVGSGARIGTNR